MRLTVGPLPATVYWRRRAMVLGGVVLACFMVFYACSAAGRPAAKAEPTPSAAPTATESAEVVAPIVAQTPTPSPTPSAAAAALDPQLCTDDELLVTAVPAKTTAASGSDFIIKLFVKNASDRSCDRDVGADLQELRIVNGTEKLWSSDDCGALTGSNLLTFPAGQENSYQVHWNGRSSFACSDAGRPAGEALAAGEYQVYGRVGTDLSEPVSLTIS